MQKCLFLVAILDSTSLTALQAWELPLQLLTDWALGIWLFVWPVSAIVCYWNTVDEPAPYPTGGGAPADPGQKERLGAESVGIEPAHIC